MPDERRRAPALRVADEDRRRVMDELGTHFASGRLTFEELETRTRLASLARIGRDLDDLLADLPRVERAVARSTALPSGIAAYVVGNVLLVVLWLATREPDPGPQDAGLGYVWPLWVALAWAVALVAVSRLGRRGARRPASA